jgi:hypothetical protein
MIYIIIITIFIIVINMLLYITIIFIIIVIIHQVGVEKSPTTVPLASTKPISLHPGRGARAGEDPAQRHE